MQLSILIAVTFNDEIISSYFCFLTSVYLGIVRVYVVAMFLYFLLSVVVDTLTYYVYIVCFLCQVYENRNKIEGRKGIILLVIVD